MGVTQLSFLFINFIIFSSFPKSCDLFQPSYIGICLQKLLSSGTIDNRAVQGGIVGSRGDGLADGHIRYHTVGDITVGTILVHPAETAVEIIGRLGGGCAEGRYADPGVNGGLFQFGNVQSVDFAADDEILKAEMWARTSL